MLTRFFAVIVAVFALARCGVKGATYSTLPDGGLNYTNGGPIDGTWLQTGATCNGTAIVSNHPTTLVIQNTTGSIKNTDTSNCTTTEAITYGYPSTSSVTLTHSGNFTCNPTSCSTSCSGPQTPESPLAFDYTLNGSTLKVTTTQSGANGDCQSGQTVEYTLTKQ